jgi:hypothetical protein
MAGTLLLQGKAWHDRHLSGRRTAPGRPQQRSPPAGRRHLRHDRCLGCPRRRRSPPADGATGDRRGGHLAGVLGRRKAMPSYSANRSTAATSRMVALVVTVVLLVAHGWAAGRAAQLRGPRLLLVTLIAGALES